MCDYIKENFFDRSKVFYPFIMQYIFTCHGINEILSRGMTKEVKRAERLYGRDKLMETFGNEGNVAAREFINKEQGVTPLLGDLSLYSKFMGSHINIDIEEISNEALANYDYLLEHMMKAAGILIIMGYENTKCLEDKNSEIWNFFYHCRNAAAHGGRFNITNMRRFPAKWGDLEITFLMNGNNLFSTPNNKDGLLAPGDPIRLLWEIEQRY